jgi:hypothetical protein
MTTHYAPCIDTWSCTACTVVPHPCVVGPTPPRARSHGMWGCITCTVDPARGTSRSMWGCIVCTVPRHIPQHVGVHRVHGRSRSMWGCIVCTVPRHSPIYCETGYHMIKVLQAPNDESVHCIHLLLVQHDKALSFTYEGSQQQLVCLSDTPFQCQLQ